MFLAAWSLHSLPTATFPKVPFPIPGSLFPLLFEPTMLTTRKLGTQGLTVSAIGLGCMRVAIALGNS